MTFRKGGPPRDQGYEVMINLDHMTITFQMPKGGDVILVGLLRRLSTVSYITFPGENVATNWKWYWKNKGGAWNMYDKDNSVSLVFIQLKITMINAPVNKLFLK